MQYQKGFVAISGNNAISMWQSPGIIEILVYIWRVLGQF